MSIVEAKMLVEKARERMNKIIDKYGVNSFEALIASKILDRRLNQYETVVSSYK